MTGETIGFLIAARVGLLVYGTLSDTLFRRVLILLTLAMGLGIVVSEII